MKPYLQQTLYDRYPALFAERLESIEESAMARGIECPDGWFGLLDALCTCLQKTSDSSEQPQVVATQVKEKFGSLRFRVRPETASTEQRGMICFAESLSRRTCGQCGNLDCAMHTPPEARASYISKRLARRSTTDALTVAQRERCHRLNLNLRDIEEWAYARAQAAAHDLRTRVENPDDPLEDFDIGLKLVFWSREGDNVIASMSHLLGDDGIGSPHDWHCGQEPPLPIGEASRCFSFQQLHESSWLDWRDIARIGHVAVEVVIREQL